MKFFFILTAILFSLASGAQNVSGFYKGTLFNDTTQLEQQYELAISEYRGKISGYSYVTFVSNDTFYYGIRRITGKIDGDNLIVTDDKFLSHNFPESPAKGVKRMFVIPLKGQDTVVNLNGTWQTNRTKKYYSIPGTVTITRSTDSAASALFAHLREMDLMKTAGTRNPATASAGNKTGRKDSGTGSNPSDPKKLSEAKIGTAAKDPVIIPYKERAKKEHKVFEVAGDSILLSFYDNGMIDGDSVSVYVNGQNLMSNTRLTAAATRRTIAFPGEEMEIVLVAENLGSIPPNTGLLVITDGSNVHQLHFSADLSTNASIKLRRKRK